MKAQEVAAMKSRQGYTGYVIEVRSHELQDGGSLRSSPSKSTMALA
jgi:hypothetical protein